MPGLTNFTPVALTESVNNIIAPKSFVLDKIFGRTKQHLASVIQVDVIIGGKKLAPFVKRGMPAKVLDKQGRKTQFFEPPHIRVKKQFGPAEVKLIRGEGQPVHTTGGSVSAGEKYIAEEQKEMKDEIVRRKEWMAIQALMGGFSYVDAAEGIDFEIDFLMPSANKPTLTGTNVWNNTTSSDPAKNISEWQAQIGKGCGRGATMSMFTNNVWNYLEANSKVQKLLDNRRVENGTLDATKIAEEYGAIYRGNLKGVDLWEYNEEYTDKDGVTQSMIPTDKFILLAPSADYRLHYAITDDLKAGMVALPYFSKMWEEEDPSGMWLLTESNPLPTPHQPQSVIAADVIE